MKLDDFILLSDGIYEFITYMDEIIVGIPYSKNISGVQRCYVIPPSKIKEFNDTNSSFEEKIALGLLIAVNPDVIDVNTKIR